MSLLQGVLKSNTEDIDSRLKNVRLYGKGGPAYEDKDDSDDDLVNVVSLPGTPARTRPSSPVRGGGGAASRPVAKNPLILSSSRLDPLKAFPTELSQRIFSRLSIKDLAKCAAVSKKWARSQTLNYVWFQHYRKENFHDESLPPGKWTKRESKQNWRQVYLKSAKDRSPTSLSFSRPSSGYNSPSRTVSGYQTPREQKEEQWRLEEEVAARPGKLEMREMYKELGGRKARTKTKLGSTGVRDKGGWDAESGEW